MPSLLRRSIAEAVGTFAFVFIGAAVVVGNALPGANYGLLGIAIAHGLALSVMISATMSISGGHLNPAVTIGLLVARRTNAVSAAAYIAAQLAGACLAALLVKLLLPGGVVRLSTLGTPIIANSVTLAQATTIEAVLTFFLMSAVFGTCVNPDAPKVAGFGVGLVLAFDILVGGTLTGAAMNPARAFGPAVVSGNFTGHAAYWVGPILGGVVATVLWEWILKKSVNGKR